MYFSDSHSYKILKNGYLIAVAIWYSQPLVYRTREKYRLYTGGSE